MRRRTLLRAAGTLALAQAIIGQARAAPLTAARRSGPRAPVPAGAPGGNRRLRGLALPPDERRGTLRGVAPRPGFAGLA